MFSLAVTTWVVLVGRGLFVMPGGDNKRHALHERVRPLVAPQMGRPDVPGMLEQVLGTATTAHLVWHHNSALEFACAIQTIRAPMGALVTPADVLTESKDHTAYSIEHRGSGGIDPG